MELKKVTKAQALEDFVINRVIGVDAFAIRTVGQQTVGQQQGLGGVGPFQCVYDKRVNGGCAIGKWIPEVLYHPRIENTPSRQLFSEFPEIAECFEDTEQDLFWSQLQYAHDSLAKHTFAQSLLAEGKTEWRDESVVFLRDNTWAQFVDAMQQVVMYAD